MTPWTLDDLRRLDLKYAEEGIHVHQRPFRAAMELLGSNFVIGVGGNPEVKRIMDAYAAGRTWKDVAALDARRERSEDRATWLGVGGGLAIGSGLMVYVLGQRAERLAPVRITPTAGGAEVSATWRF